MKYFAIKMILMILNFKLKMNLTI